MHTRLPRCLAVLSTTLVTAAAASAVLIDSGDGTGNTTAPSPDPGWSYVARYAQASLTAVYLGNGWMLTADHNSAGDVVLDGVVYPYVAGSDVQLLDPLPPHNPVDLRMFQISPYPDWPLLPIAANPLPLGTPLVMIGDGHDRGPATAWDPDPLTPPGPYYGYSWGACCTMRWGTNNVDDYPAERVYDTKVFDSSFDQGGSPHEAATSNGDSGGAAFAWNGTSYELGGLLIAARTYGLDQPYQTSLYGNGTYSADLAFYRGYILVVMPEPVGGLWAGVALTALLAARKRRRIAARAAPPASSCRSCRCP